YGDPQGSHTLVVYGDSHGRMWLPAFDAIGKFAHWKVLQLTKGHCQVADYSTWLDSEKRVYGECIAFRSFALDRIRRLHPDVVVLASMWKDALMAVNGRPTTKGLAAAWAAGLASMITKIKQSAKKVIVLGDIAYPKQAGADCLSLHRDDIRPCNTPRVDAVFEADNSIDRTVATRQGALYVNTIPWFCTATVCPAVVADLPRTWTTTTWRQTTHYGLPMRWPPPRSSYLAARHDGSLVAMCPSLMERHAPAPR